MTESLDENMRGMGDPADYDAWARETPEPAAGRGAQRAARAAYAMEVVEYVAAAAEESRGATVTLDTAYVREVLDASKRLTTQLAICRGLREHDQERMDSLAADRGRWHDAVELLHSLILRDLPNDGSEIPQPEDPWWAAQLDRIVTEAAAIYAAALRSE